MGTTGAEAPSGVDREGIGMYTRESFERQRAAIKGVERREAFILVAISVGLGFAQLGFLRWADFHLARAPKLAIAGPAFIVYLFLVAWRLWHFERARRQARPKCPHCNAPLEEMSQRIAIATGKCDTCGHPIFQ